MRVTTDTKVNNKTIYGNVFRHISKNENCEETEVYVN